ncbi:hypothetical protein Hanom_Chr10g00875401 [Helianthus anomalus]
MVLWFDGIIRGKLWFDGCRLCCIWFDGFIRGYCFCNVKFAHCLV